jgi:glycosyltransferase involved in cell wall biosynthesis
LSVEAVDMAVLKWLGQPWWALNRLITTRALTRRVRRPAGVTPYHPERGSMLYVAASALPYHVSGYTTRTHEVIRALRSISPEVHVMTRPGYPWDRRDRLADADGTETSVAGVPYKHVGSPTNLRPVLQYALQAAQPVIQEAMRHRVAVIHAASNHVNALPALLAARHLGVPFQYEMRGLWELTRISRIPHYERHHGFRQGLELEGLVASHADRLFVISEQLGRFAHERWGIDRDRMLLLPNCVEPERFALLSPAEVEPNTIGYAGSLVAYEGLDTLVEAVALLREHGVRANVNIIGDGEARAALEEEVRRFGLSDCIRFFGRMLPQEAQETLSRCALVCIPRKPFKVCEIVPPIKLVEAMAMGKAVIVPDLPVFRDEMGAQPAGWFFKAGDAADLAKVIETALSDRATLRALGERAKEYAAKHRCWRDFVIEALPKSAE